MRVLLWRYPNEIFENIPDPPEHAVGLVAAKRRCAASQRGRAFEYRLQGWTLPHQDVRFGVFSTA